MKIAVSGSGGLIGRALVDVLRADGHDILRLVRRTPSGADEARWDPAAHGLDPGLLADVDAVVHLAGAGIADKRWTEGYKQQVLASRVDGTTTVAAAVAAADPRPRVLLSASAVGWYGDTGDRRVDETAPAGAGFLADVVRRWEAATVDAEAAGARTVHLRTGLVCAPHGGLLRRLLPLARLGVLSPLGSGRQYQPWISLADEVDAIAFVLNHEQISGPVNLTGPEPLTNTEFTRELLSVLGRPAVLPSVPGFALRLVLGEFADEGVLVGQRAVPRVLERAGYAFTHPTLRAALRWCTARTN